jgi:SOS response regulatory protein OraA/RecX
METEIHKVLLKRAGALLARRAYSHMELRNKLAGLAEDMEIEAVLNRLEHLNLLNDGDYAYNFALRRIRQLGWSPAKVKYALLRHHVGMPIIECALERVLGEMGSQSTMILQYIQRHCGKKGLPTDQKGIGKLIYSLSHRGFDNEHILRALKGILPASALQPFETGE